MKVSKVLLVSLIFLVGSILLFGNLPDISAEENGLVAQLTQQGTTPTVKPKLDCKVVEEKDKAGNIIYKLIGKDCDAIAKQVNAHKVKGMVCCECKREGTIIVCRGKGSDPCCAVISSKISK